MTRRLIAAIVRLMARIFFRRIEIAGMEHVPRADPVIFAVNHPNALIDPVFLLCFAPRRVSFLAKAPLFRTPLIGWIARAFDSIPVYRRQDAQQECLCHKETVRPSRKRDAFSSAAEGSPFFRRGPRTAIRVCMR